LTANFVLEVYLLFFDQMGIFPEVPGAKATCNGESDGKRKRMIRIEQPKWLSEAMHSKNNI